MVLPAGSSIILPLPQPLARARGKPFSKLLKLQFFYLHPRIIVGGTAGGLNDTLADQNIALRPMHLEVASRDRGKKYSTFVMTNGVGQPDALILNQPQRGGVLRT